MPDAAELLQRLYVAGFDLQTYERFPRAVGVGRGDCIVLVEPAEGDQGLRFIGRPGWKLGEVLGVLTTRDGRQVFQSKQAVVEATPERLEALRAFESDVRRILAEGESPGD